MRRGRCPAAGRRTAAVPLSHRPRPERGNHARRPIRLSRGKPGCLPPLVERACRAQERNERGSTSARSGERLIRGGRVESLQRAKVIKDLLESEWIETGCAYGRQTKGSVSLPHSWSIDSMKPIGSGEWSLNPQTSS